MYPRSVSIPIDEASISLIFRKIPVMVRCIVAGLERGEGFAQLWNFSNFLGKTRPPMHVNPKIKLRKRRAPKMRFGAGPQTKLRTDRKLPVLYYISYVYVFPHTKYEKAEKYCRQKQCLNFSFQRQNNFSFLSANCCGYTDHAASF